MTKATNTVARVAAAVAGLGLVAMSFAPAVGAQTSTTTTTTTTTSATFSRNLHKGSTGADVTALQTFLIGKGFSIAAGATGYFGSQTKAALSAFQAANNISPAVGFFGPITRGVVNSMGGGSTTTTGGSTGSLSGGEGTLTNFKNVGASATTLNAGASNTVYGVEFQASGSDLSVNRVSFDAYLSSGTGSTRPWTVFQKAQLMRGSTVIATLDASDMNNWSQDGTAGNGNTQYRLNYVGLNDVVMMGKTADYYVVLSTQSNINSANNGNVYTFFLPTQGIRATDAKGLSEYTSNVGTNATVTVSSNVAGSLTLSTASDNPAAVTLQASQSAQTSDVTLASFTLNAQSGDVTVYTIPVSIATTSNNASDIIRQIKLYQGSTLLDTESYAAGSASTSVKFKNLNAKISQGSSQSFRVAADINQVGGVNTVSDGASVAVSIPNAGFEAVNSAGNNVTVTGSVAGNTITFRSNGLSADAAPSSATASAQAVGTTGTQQGSFVFTFNVTAFGQDVYISKNAATSTSYSLLSNGTASGATSTVGLTMNADTSANGNYVVHAGQTKQVTVTITVPAGNSTTINAKLNSITYSLSDSTGAGPIGSSALLNNNYQTPGVFIHS